jgi:hypothetical protein
MPNKFYFKVDFSNANVKGKKHGKVRRCHIVLILVILEDAKALQIKRECNRV